MTNCVTAHEVLEVNTHSHGSERPRRTKKKRNDIHGKSSVIKIQITDTTWVKWTGKKKRMRRWTKSAHTSKHKTAPPRFAFTTKNTRTNKNKTAPLPFAYTYAISASNPLSRFELYQYATPDAKAVQAATPNKL